MLKEVVMVDFIVCWNLVLWMVRVVVVVVGGKVLSLMNVVVVMLEIIRKLLVYWIVL